MTEPLISVVIPSYRRPALVQRAVRSALAQTFAELEVLVVLDNADPESQAQLKTVPDPRLKVISVPEPVGGSRARNIGVRAARAEWIALLDDDDEWFPQKLEKQIAAGKSSRYQYPIVAASVIARTPSADLRWPRKLPYSPLSEYLFVRNSLFQGEALLQTSTLLTKRELLLNIPFTPGLRRHQDWDWILRAGESPGAGIEFIPEPLAVWYIDDPFSPLKTQYHWRYSLEWMRANRHLLTPKAYAGLCAVTLSSQAAWQGDWKAFLPLLRETVTAGKPRVMDMLLFFAMWLVPRSVRRSIRSLVQKDPSPTRLRAAIPSPEASAAAFKTDFI
jgi:glycosyltransferase involved in cell wall biosynthesis